ncbi:hypothetical protein DZC30_18850 [Comamonas testosteroni]|uniref:Uncharacterized protein n=1 Tax=Comamonas testosteroni TaxID=285 RepID=A0A373FD80_COMTE|nr:hypothetical protein DZC30_18850 [Comamonas testosteroni]
MKGRDAMKQYRLDYIAMHDDLGNPISTAPITIKTFVPVLNNMVAYLAFVRRVVADAKAFNMGFCGQVPFDFYVSRAKHYGYLYTEVPKGLVEALKFYKDFFVRML